TATPAEPIQLEGPGADKCQGGEYFRKPLYVFLAARKVMRQGGTTSMGNNTAFALEVIVVISDPVGKSHRKT
uniref:Uncharacterized protein n=1 Tax=Oncorhynchus kisutch TaxID=8019 RepID=A0A8C7JF90_ONCKI